jgi:hypothetical protein
MVPISPMPKRCRSDKCWDQQPLKVRAFEPNGANGQSAEAWNNAERCGLAGAVGMMDRGKVFRAYLGSQRARRLAVVSDPFFL